MPIISPKNWLVKKLIYSGAALFFVGMQLYSSPTPVSAYNFDDIIRSFERDFNRENPVKMQGRFEAIIQDITQMASDKKVNIVFRSRGDVKQEHFSMEMEKQTLKDEDMIRGFEYLLKQFGLLEKDFTLKEALLGTQYDNIYGFYDPQKKHIVVIEGTDNSIARQTLFHELVHSAQDKTIDLTKLYEKYGDGVDSSLAVSALVEGQASAVPIIVQVEQNLQGKTTTEILKPFIDQMGNDFYDREREEKAFLSDLNTFPYFFGLRFVLQRYVNGGSNFIDMFEKVPCSTEQILHLEKFDKNEGPVITPLEKKRPMISKLSNVKLLLETTLGEFFISQIFFDVLETERMREVSAGWGGDRVFVLEAEDEVYFIWDTVWDSEKDAQEFYQAFFDFSKKFLDVENPIQRDDSNAVLRKGKTQVDLKRAKERVVIIQGNIPPDTLKTLKEI